MSNGCGTLLARAICAVIGGGKLPLNVLSPIGRITLGLFDGQFVDHFGERGEKALRRIRRNRLPTVKSKVERLFQVDAGKARETHGSHQQEGTEIAGNDGEDARGRAEFSRPDERKKSKGDFEQRKRCDDAGGKGELVSFAYLRRGAQGQNIAWQDGFTFKCHDEVLGNAKDAADDGHKGHDPSVPLS